MEEMHVNFMIFSKYGNVELHNLIEIAITMSNVFIFYFFDKNGIQGTYTKPEANQGKAIETIKAKQSGKERRWYNHAQKSVNSN